MRHLQTSVVVLLILGVGCRYSPLSDFDGDGDIDDRDCDPEDPEINHGADEVCDDGVDNDCDGHVDGDDTECSGDDDAGDDDAGDDDAGDDDAGDDDAGDDDAGDDDAGDCSEILFESFEVDVPPADWEEYRVSGSSNNHWTFTSGMQGFWDPIDGLNCAGLHYDVHHAQDQALETPTLDLSGCASIDLSFLHQQSGNYGDTLKVEYSLNQGSWVEQASFTTVGTDLTWQNRAVAFGSDIDQQSDVRIRFRFVGQANTNSETLDAVRLAGTDSPPMP